MLYIIGQEESAGLSETQGTDTHAGLFYFISLCPLASLHLPGHHVKLSLFAWRPPHNPSVAVKAWPGPRTLRGLWETPLCLVAPRASQKWLWPRREMMGEQQAQLTC